MAIDVDAVEGETVELLDGLCLLPSVSAEGDALTETADFVEALRAESGFDMRQLRADAGPAAVWGELRSVAERVADRTASIDPLFPASLPAVASPARHVRVPGLSAPDNAYYSGCAAHAPNEHIRLKDIAPAVRYFALLLDELGA